MRMSHIYQPVMIKELLTSGGKSSIRALAFAAADAKTVEPLIGTTTSIFLPAGPGCFVGTVISGQTASERKYIYPRLRTFLPANRLKRGQTLLPRTIDAEGTVAIKPRHWADHGLHSKAVRTCLALTSSPKLAANTNHRASKPYCHFLVGTT
jgi:hypothetical protein